MPGQGALPGLTYPKELFRLHRYRFSMPRSMVKRTPVGIMAP